MMYTVGPKGQVVIPKVYRDRLGVRPGWVAVANLVDDHVEVRFLPPEHDRSLKGSLAPFIKGRVTPGRAWDEARGAAWVAETGRFRYRKRKPS